ncbi:hypothetical protein [Bacillus fonticola]|uniref:hypothetical protein n=1 Tax=Bacillus fonticola TaxID=2728853 RepID=UPI001474B4AD|nr:hypothetical protein [Bacillus fonticola]
MRKKYNSYTFQNWMKNARAIAQQLVIPFTVFQVIRTVIFPTTFDVLLLALFIFIALAFYYEWL